MKPSKKQKRLLITALVLVIITPLSAIFLPNLILMIVCPEGGLCGSFIVLPLIAGSIVVPLLTSLILVLNAVSQNPIKKK